MYTHHNQYFKRYFIVSNNDQISVRIDKFLVNLLQNISRSKIQNLIQKQCVLVNGMSVKSNYKLKLLDVVLVFFEKLKENIQIIPENISLSIIYEDQDLLIVNKSSGMVVHPGYGNNTGTLINALIYYFNFIKKDDCELKDEPGLVHRIDKDTSGLLLVAKNNCTMQKLLEQFVNRTVKRVYIALVWGDVKNDTGSINVNIGRNLKNRIKMSVSINNSYGKFALTHYRVIERFNYVTLLECNLSTGRTHQIRVHMQYIGHPLFNDHKYGGNQILVKKELSRYNQFIKNCFEILPRQALHAKTLEFIHPRTHQKMLFDSELPTDIYNVIQKCRNYI